MEGESGRHSFMQKWVVICSLGLLAAPSLSKVDARAETAHVLHVSIFGVPISLRQAESKKGCRKSRPAGLRHSLFVVKVCAPKYDRVIRYSFPSSDNMLNILQERLAQFDIYIPLYFCYARNVHIPAVSSSICQGSSLMSSLVLFYATTPSDSSHTTSITAKPGDFGRKDAILKRRSGF